jgi:hypothetical protein
MIKFLLRSVVFSTFLIIVCAGIAHNEVRAKPMAEPMTDMGPHMSMTKLRPLAPGDQARADAILAAAKKAAERYRDYRKAEADGYTIFMPDQRQNVYHFIRESSNLGDKERFDPEQPPALLYTKIEGRSPGYKLTGVMYMARYSATDDELNARIPLSIVQWHVHLNMCVPPHPGERNWLMGDPTFGLTGSITTEEACTAAGGYFKPHLSGWMVHVYPFETDPAKVWGVAMVDDHGMENDSMPGMKM